MAGPARGLVSIVSPFADLDHRAALLSGKLCVPSPPSAITYASCASPNDKTNHGPGSATTSRKPVYASVEENGAKAFSTAFTAWKVVQRLP